MAQVLIGNWWVLALRGVFAIIFAIIAFFWPAITATALVLLFGAYALVDGVLALIGGMVGVLLGFGVAEAVTLVVGVPSRVEVWAIVAALIVSASVGVFFGVYPARKAANLDPIAALRFEL